MKQKYSVIIRGENFQLNFEGQANTYGFVTTRRVKASTVEEAKKEAIKLVENDAQLQSLMVLIQNEEIPPTLYVEEMYELSWWKTLGGKGFTFFNQD